MHNVGDKKLIIFGGKGGTGKTTCSSAAGIHLAESESLNVLVVSIDPAHSLGDSLGAEISDEPGPVEEVDHLDAVELNADSLIQDYRDKYSGYLEQLLERGTYLDQTDISELLELPLPGIDEITAVLKINDYYREEKYDVVILDTPPTGHLYNLLDLPEQMLRWLEVLDLMAEKHRYIKSTFVGDYPEDEIEDFLQHQKEQLEFTRDLLTDDSLTQFFPVLTPDNLSYRETRRLFRNTGLTGITSTVVFNRVQPGGGCEVCRRRTERAKDYLNRFREDFPDLQVNAVRRFPKPVSGISALRKLGEDLFDENSRDFFSGHDPLDEEKTTYCPPNPGKFDDSRVAFNSKYLLFGGKGGVGKTTTAVSTALNLSNKQGEKVLILSIDPAGSLNDLFSDEIGRRPVQIDSDGPGELHALETKPDEELEDLKGAYRKSIEEGFNSYSKSTGVSLEYDRKILSRLFTLIPPGVNEIIALVNLIELVDDASYDRVIVDTAPTGHLLRFLELPGLASNWLSTMLEVSLKYRKVINARKITDRVASMARKVRDTRSLLFSSEGASASLIAVTVPETMANRETFRLISRAGEAGIGKTHLLINKFLQGELCSTCRRERKVQENRIKELLEADDYATIAVAPYLLSEPDDRKSLLEFSERFMEKRV